MNDITEIRKIAEQKLEDAKLLIEDGRADNAFYLVGYAIELELKAKICERIDVPDLFDESINIPGIGEVRRKYKTHNLRELLIQSGLWRKYDAKKAEDHDFFEVSSYLLEWNENCRYKPSNSYEPSDVELLIQFLEDPDDGFIKWIRSN